MDSPTCSRQGLRLAFATASTMNWEIKAMDISAAFLQGNTLKRTVLVRPPPDVSEGKLWRLKRCLYGLSDAPREWYDRVCEEMTRLGGKRSVYDKSLFMWHDPRSQLVGLITTHVDDFEYCGTVAWQNEVIT